MVAMTRRIERINNLIRHEISDLLQRQVKDPRLGNFISVTAVATSSDLKYARIFVSRIGNEAEKQAALNGLVAASGFLRNELAKNWQPGLKDGQVAVLQGPGLGIELDERVVERLAE